MLGFCRLMTSISGLKALKFAATAVWFMNESQSCTWSVLVIGTPLSGIRETHFEALHTVGCQQSSFTNVLVIARCAERDMTY